MRKSFMTTSFLVLASCLPVAHAEDSCTMYTEGTDMVFDDACLDILFKDIRGDEDIDINKIIESLAPKVKDEVAGDVDDAMGKVELNDDDIKEQKLKIETNVSNARHLSVHKVMYQMNPKNCISGSAPDTEIQVRYIMDNDEITEAGRFKLKPGEPVIAPLSELATSTNKSMYKDRMYGGMHTLYQDGVMKDIYRLKVIASDTDKTNYQVYGYGDVVASTASTPAGMPIVVVDCS